MNFEINDETLIRKVNAAMFIELAIRILPCRFFSLIAESSLFSVALFMNLFSFKIKTTFFK